MGLVMTRIICLTLDALNGLSLMAKQSRPAHAQLVAAKHAASIGIHSPEIDNQIGIYQLNIDQMINLGKIVGPSEVDHQLRRKCSQLMSKDLLLTMKTACGGVYERLRRMCTSQLMSPGSRSSEPVLVRRLARRDCTSSSGGIVSVS